MAVASYHGISPVADPNLIEIGYGDWESLYIDQIPSLGWAEEYSKFRDDPVNHRPPNGETIDEILKRVRISLDSVRTIHSEESICMVGHSGSIRAILTLALAGTHNTWARLKLKNAALSEITFDHNSAKLSVERVNDFSFLN